MEKYQTCFELRSCRCFMADHPNAIHLTRLQHLASHVESEIVKDYHRNLKDYVLIMLQKRAFWVLFDSDFTPISGQKIVCSKPQIWHGKAWHDMA